MINIEIGGKQRPFKFGFNAINIFCKERKVNFSEFQELMSKMGSSDIDVQMFIDLLFAGLSAGAHTSRIPVDFTAWDIGDWMDSIPAEELPKVLQAITDSMTIDKKKVEAGQTQEI